MAYLKLAQVELSVAQRLFQELQVMKASLSEYVQHTQQNDKDSVDVLARLSTPELDSNRWQQEKSSVLVAFEHGMQQKVKVLRIGLLRALAACRRAMQLEPENPHAHFWFGHVLLFLLGNRTQGVHLETPLRALSKVLQLRPDQAEVSYCFMSFIRAIRAIRAIKE